MSKRKEAARSKSRSKPYKTSYCILNSANCFAKVVREIRRPIKDTRKENRPPSKTGYPPREVLSLIVQCDKCLTKFKISDDKVRGKVVRIRCAKCHQPFTVQGEKIENKKEAPSVAPPEPETAEAEASAGQEPSHTGTELDDIYKDFSAAKEDSDAAPATDDDTFGGADFSLSDGEADLDVGTEKGFSAADTEEADEEKDHKEDSTSSLLLSIGEDLNEGTESTQEPSSEEETTGEDSSLELNTDSSYVEGDDEESNKTEEDSPSEDFALDSEEDEFVPEAAPPEDIIDDEEDSGELDLGIGTGVTIDPDYEDSDDASLAPSIEDTLEDSGFGFSADNADDDEDLDFAIEDSADEDFTEDLDELPEVSETDNPEFEAGLLETPQDGSEPEDEETSFTPEEDIEESFEAEKQEEQEASDLEDLPAEDTSEDFGITEEAVPEDEEVFTGFADTPVEDMAEDEDGAENFAITEEAAPANDEVFKGFADEPAAETFDATQEPAEEVSNPEPPLPFETRDSPRPVVTFTPEPPMDEAPEYSTAEAAEAPESYASEKKKAPTPKWLLLVILAAIVYGGIGALYMGGVIGSSQSRPAELAPIRVERIRGVFIQNKEMGRIFAIEGRIRNFSEEPQGIRMIRGVLHNDKGRVIAAKKVTPGKIIPRETLKTITRAELRKKLSGVPGGSIPPKGSIPVMIVFTKLPKGFAGAGIEVFRR